MNVAFIKIHSPLCCCCSKWGMSCSGNRVAFVNFVSPLHNTYSIHRHTCIYINLYLCFVYFSTGVHLVENLIGFFRSSHSAFKTVRCMLFRFLFWAVFFFASNSFHAVPCILFKCRKLTRNTSHSTSK